MQTYIMDKTADTFIVAVTHPRSIVSSTLESLNVLKR